MFSLLNSSFLWCLGTVIVMLVIVFCNSEDDRILQTALTTGRHSVKSDEITTVTASQKKQYNYKPIQQISVLGERHSGAEQVYKHIEDCFGHALKIRPSLVRGQPWFQTTAPSAAKPSHPHDTLVLAVVRNPYDWFEAMRRQPDYCGFAADQNWHPFIARDWKSTAAEQERGGGRACQERFAPAQVLPCRDPGTPLAASDAFFELDPETQQPFENIMMLRRAKIQNWLSLSRTLPGIAGVWTVQAEFLQQHGSQSLLHKIEAWTNVPAKCDAMMELDLEGGYELDQDYAMFVNRQVEWSTEGLIGYVQRDIEPLQRGNETS